MTPTPPTDPPTATDIDKDQLYGRFQSAEQWREDLARKMAHKALDIPCDDMNIEANRVTHNHYYGRPPKSEGVGSGLSGLGKVLIGTALAIGTGGAGLGIWGLLQQPAEKLVEKVLTRDTDVTAGEATVEPPSEPVQ